MPLKKLRDLAPFQPCNHPEHNPPTMIVLSPGVYEHTCPACGKKQQFVVNRPSHLSASSYHTQSQAFLTRSMFEAWF